MNCKDIARLLDERDIGRLTSMEHAQVTAHLAACDDCAWSWHVFERLLARKYDAMLADYPARLWRELDRSPKIEARRSGRTVLFGGLLLVGAVAAMVGWQAARVRAPVQPAAALSTSSTTPPPATSTPIGDPFAASTIAAAAPDNPPASPNAFQHRLVVLPTAHGIDDPETIYTVEQLRAVILRELRSLPILDVIELSQSAIDAANLSISPGLSAGPANSLSTASFDTSRARAIVEHFGGESALTLRSFTLSGGGLEDRSILEVQRATPGRSGGASRAMVSDIDAESVEPRGAHFARETYVSLFPDAALATWEAVFTDASTTDAERLAALSALRSVNSLTRFSDAAIAGVIELARNSTDPTTRLEVWRELGLVSIAVVKEPLTDALLYDIDPKVRRVAAKSLYTYLPDEVVAAALESVATSDTSADVRLQARWSLMSAKERASYTAESLRDASLSTDRRIAPLILYQQGYDAALDDDLLSILEDIGPRSADLSTRAAALRALGRSDAPARRAAAIDALRNDPDPSIRSAAAAALSQKTSEPDVSAALESALESETDAQVREVIELYLQRR